MTAVVKVTSCDGAAVLTVFKEWDREFKCEGTGNVNVFIINYKGRC